MGFGRRVHIKTDEEVELLRESSLLVGKTLAAVASRIRPGATTLELDAVAEEFIRDHGAEPGFKGYGGFPNSLCTSVNEAVVHGIPDDRPLEEGDIVSIDCGVLKNEFYGDSAYTFAVGEIAPEVQQLLDVTKECLRLAIEQAVVGKRIGDIGFACQQHAEQNGYGVVRELVGHGLGRSLHEAPEVPNYGRRGNGPRLMDGMVLAIEPMINLGRKEVFHLEDGWTIVSIDCGVLKNEFYGDSAYTFAVGEIAPEVQQLLDVTKECLRLAIEQAVVGKRIGDIGFACQQHAEQNGYGVVRELVGHGLGRSLHEAPEVPNYGRRGNGPRLMDGMVLAIEPMINLGRKEVFHLEDGWTIVTADRKVSAHFEHDIVVRKGQADVLSSFDEIEKVLQH